MKTRQKIVGLMSMTMLMTASFAQNQYYYQNNWSTNNTSSDHVQVDFQVALYGDQYQAGYYESSGNTTGILQKTDFNGAHAWTVELGNDKPENILALNSGCYINAIDKLIAISPSGSYMWGRDCNDIRDVTQSFNGNPLIVRELRTSGGGNLIHVAEFDHNNGAVIDQKDFFIQEINNAEFYEVNLIERVQGGYIIVAEANTSSAEIRSYVIKLDFNLDPVFVRELWHNDALINMSIAEMSEETNGDLTFVGTQWVNNNYGYHIDDRAFVIQLDATLSSIKFHERLIEENEVGNHGVSIAEHNGNHYITGNISDTQGNRSYVCQINSQGDVQWAKKYHSNLTSPSSSNLNPIIRNAYPINLVVGNSETFSAADDMVLMRIHYNGSSCSYEDLNFSTEDQPQSLRTIEIEPCHGNSEYEGIEAEISQVNKLQDDLCMPMGKRNGAVLMNNSNEAFAVNVYPNPSFGETTIEFSTDSNQLDIIDMNGKVVISRLVSGKTFQVPDLSAGIYLVKVTNGDVVKTEKLIIQ